MNCRRENHFQLAITTGQYSWDRCFTACCWDLPWKNIYILWHSILFKTRKAKILFITDTDYRIVQNKASTNISFIQQSYKHSSHFPKKLKKYTVQTDKDIQYKIIFCSLTKILPKQTNFVDPDYVYGNDDLFRIKPSWMKST